MRAWMAGHWRRLRVVGAYAVVVLALAYAMYEVGPAADHRQCVTANGSRSDIREAFHITILGLGTPDQVTDLDKRVQSLLAKGLPIRDCSTVGRLW